MVNSSQGNSGDGKTRCSQRLCSFPAAQCGVQLGERESGNAQGTCQLPTKSLVCEELPLRATCIVGAWSGRGLGVATKIIEPAEWGARALKKREMT